MTKKILKSQNKKTEIGKNVVTKDMNLADVLFKFPDLAEVFTDYGLHCVGCYLSGFDTIETGASLHGLSAEEIDEMVERANEVINHSE